jgi:hypothetical protein
MISSPQGHEEHKVPQRNDLLVLGSLVLLAFITYLPALGNFFIADDFVYLRQAKIASRHLSHLLHFEPGGGLFRITGHCYFLLGYKLFGLDPRGFYALGLVLHVVNSWLVCRLAARLTGRREAGIAAGLFFAVYERHHEAVMWISAVQELLMALGALVCLLAWLRFSPAHGRPLRRAGWYALALGAFVFALFSKESALVVVPLLIGLDLHLHIGAQQAALLRRRLLWYAPFLLAGVAHAAWVCAADSFVAHGFYAVGFHFFTVYPRSLNILLLYVYPFMLAALLLRLRPATCHLSPATWFFFAWLLITPVPYCFVTYLDRIPSRQTYLPSVATSALIGILGMYLWESVTAGRATKRQKTVLLALCLAMVALNVAFVWNKNAQFVKRAAPIKLLLDTLREHRAAEQPGAKIYVVTDSPPYELIARSAIGLWTPIDPSRLLFRKSSERLDLQPADYLFHWDDKREKLIVRRTPEWDAEKRR